MKIKNVFSLIAVLGIIITAAFTAQPPAQAAEAIQAAESNATLTVSVVPLYRTFGRAWTQVGPNQSVLVPGSSANVSNIGQKAEQILVQWGDVYVTGIRQPDDTWKVTYLKNVIKWDPFVSDLRLEGTVNSYTGYLIIDQSANMLYLTWHFNLAP